MYRFPRACSALALATAATFALAACQAPTSPERSALNRTEQSIKRIPSPMDDSLTCLTGYTVANGIVTCS